MRAGAERQRRETASERAIAPAGHLANHLLPTTGFPEELARRSPRAASGATRRVRPAGGISPPGIASSVPTTALQLRQAWRGSRSACPSRVVPTGRTGAGRSARGCDAAPRKRAHGRICPLPQRMPPHSAHLLPRRFGRAPCGRVVAHRGGRLPTRSVGQGVLRVGWLGGVATAAHPPARGWGRGERGRRAGTRWRGAPRKPTPGARARREERPKRSKQRVHTSYILGVWCIAD